MTSPTRVRSADRVDSDSLRNAKRALKQIRSGLLDAQSRLFACHQDSILIILQGMDTSGKDGLIRHVFRYANPVGLAVHSFGPPTDAEEREHFLDRYRRALPPQGHICVFNRSYYEQLMYLRVHPQPQSKGASADELQTILRFEDRLVHNNTVLLKFFLHISKEQQRVRLLSRANNPEKSWKLQRADLVDRRLWLEHYDAFQDAIEKTHSDQAPWYVIPADDKWMARYVVVSVVLDVLHQLAPEYPVPDQVQRKLISDVRRELD